MALLPDELAGGDDNAPPGNDGFDSAVEFHPLETGVVNVHVVSLCGHDRLCLGIDDDDVRVRSNGNGAFLRIQPKYLRRCRCTEDSGSVAYPARLRCHDIAGTSRGEG